MTITTVHAAIQAKNLTIAGVEAAPVAFPGSLNTADMPIVIAWPDGATNQQEAMSFDFSQRTWRLACYVKPAEQGQGISEGWSEAMTLMQSMIDFWLDSDNCSLVSGTYQAFVQQGRRFPLTDGGIEMIAYPPPATGTEGWPHYFGFELRLTTNEKWSQT